MPTSMLDALAAEAKEITLLGAEASRLAIEALRRSNLLTKQIRHMADEDRLLAMEEGSTLPALPVLSADATNEEFEQFQATYFPDFLVFLGPKDSNSPGDSPAARIDGQGKQGFGEVAPGGATAREQAEPEEVGADTVSGEQRLTAVCKDPETGPDAKGTLSTRVLDLYASTDYDPREIAKKVGSTTAAVNEFIRQGRKNQNRLAAQGDLRRDIGVEVALAARAGRERPKPAELPVPAERPAKAIPDALIEPIQKPGLTMSLDGEPKEGQLLALDKDKVTAAFRGQGIQLARHEWRLLLRMNDQQPKSPEQMLQFAGVLQQRRLRSDLSKLNARLALIDVEIHFDDVSYTLRPLQVA